MSSVGLPGLDTMHKHSTRKFLLAKSFHQFPNPIAESSSPPPSPNPAVLESCQSSAPLLTKELPTARSWRTFLASDVDSEHDSTTGLLALFCFMTGFIDAISFTAVFVWCGFQTGNFAQLALASARTWSAQELVFSTPDIQALVSLFAFNIGAFVGRIGDRVGPQSRGWLVSGTAQSGQGSIALARGEPSWTSALTFVALALMAASLGLQGIMAKRLNTHFSTTVVLTAVWVELMADPQLFCRRKNASRDHKRIGAAGALGFGAGIRLFVAAGWCFHVIMSPTEVPDYGTLARGSPPMVEASRWW
ncbi:hypothetical protein B0H14DRAFT_2700069 [Mycena olivaceomarginata]|nr:hypothetical protein B0H14DRAFT_2700069 [Mycena olivaceomarginata]